MPPTDPVALLVTSCRDGDARGAQKALELGANPNRRYGINTRPRSQPIPPLVWAIQKGYKDLAKVLLSHSCIDVNIRGSHSDCPLLHAAFQGDIESMQLLLSREDIDVNSADANGHTALIMATRADELDSMKLLLNHRDCDLERRELWNRTALLHAKSAEAAYLLLSHGANPNAGEHSVESALELASASSSFEHVRILLEHGASPLIRDPIACIMDTSIVQPPRSERKREILRNYLANVWQGGIPSLYHLCIWKIKRLRIHMDEEYVVDCLPDAMIWEHFRNWKGAEKWCIDLLESECKSLRSELKSFRGLKRDVAEFRGDFDRLHEMELEVEEAKKRLKSA